MNCNIGNERKAVVKNRKSWKMIDVFQFADGKGTTALLHFFSRFVKACPSVCPSVLANITSQIVIHCDCDPPYIVEIVKYIENIIQKVTSTLFDVSSIGMFCKFLADKNGRKRREKRFCTCTLVQKFRILHNNTAQSWLRILFLVACYAALWPAMSVGWLVGPSIHLR